ncbi:hypothetical protein [Sphingobacterium deserti]|uniref:Uncharacterized protein n=1 Tax=Sphingobacterium deserti TaxID=1229276 RepID=A0A0B8SZU6_9SPHI|nr:hypothetical protein [Sphingobacterium deserti]KGE13201.1 hypothetical protein DI53_3037 [Sphingobacterium deserti]
MRILLLVILVAILMYYISRRFFMKGPTTSIMKPTQQHNLQLVDSDTQVIAKAAKSTLVTVGIGIILFFVILLIGFKIKILWIALPLALYLIGQLFVYSNHLKAIRKYRMYYDPEQADVLVYNAAGESMHFNLLRDVQSVSEVKSVQANKGTLFGYYKLRTSKGELVIPYLVEQHGASINRQFFDALNQNFKIEVETKLFPII